jgi:hypothetical protein
MKFHEYFPVAEVGDLITCHVDQKIINGMVGEIDEKNNRLYLWHNDSHCDGTCGSRRPTNGYRFAWAIVGDNYGKTIVHASSGSDLTYKYV